jgi:hypothetical protein
MIGARDWTFQGGHTLFRGSERPASSWRDEYFASSSTQYLRSIVHSRFEGIPDFEAVVGVPNGARHRGKHNLLFMSPVHQPDR